MRRLLRGAPIAAAAALVVPAATAAPSTSVAGATGFLVRRGSFDPAAFTGSDVLTGWISSTD